MNNLTRYEKELAAKLNQSALPDENQAWEAMSKMLDEDEDDDNVLPPPPIKRAGCALWILMTIILASGIAIYYLQKNNSKQSGKVIGSNTIQANSQSKLNADSFQLKQDNNKEKKVTTIIADNKLTIKDSSESAIAITNTISKNNITQTAIKQNSSDEYSYPKKRITKILKRTKNIDAKTKVRITESEITDSDSNKKNDEQDSISNNINTDSALNKKDTLVEKKIQTDTLQKNQVDTASTQINPEKNKRKQHFWSAGLALFQQLPLDSERFNPYNALGRNISLSDYIPAIYLRYNNSNKKWFLQSEFRYGAPQQTKELVYNLKRDTSAQKIDTALRLKRMYYHQLPISFNYYILPNLSIGAGVVWNKFSSAISEREIIQRNSGTIDSILINKIFRSKVIDSTFSKSYFQFLAEIQYCYRRFTIGARYTRGIQPYIEFTLPDEPTRREKNNSLQLFLRYELWQSPKK